MEGRDPIENPSCLLMCLWTAGLVFNKKILDLDSLSCPPKAKRRLSRVVRKAFASLMDAAPFTLCRLQTADGMRHHGPERMNNPLFS